MRLVEMVVGLMAGIAIWAGGRIRPRRDPAVAARLSGLRSRAASRAPRWIRRPRPLLMLGRMLPGDRAKLSSALSVAGISSSPEVIAGVKLALAMLGAILGLALGPAPPISAAIAGFAGYRAPDGFIRLRAINRRDEVAVAIPDVVDLLAVCAQAGLNLPLALARVAERTPGVLGEELRRALHQIELGVPRARALEELSARNETKELQALVGALANVERFGTRVASALNALSADIRTTRRRRAEEEARRAPVKILFPLVLLILPGFILISLVPLLIGAFETLGF